MWLFICVLGICLLNRTAKRFLSLPSSCLVSWISAAQEKRSCKCLTSEVTAMPLMRYMFYISLYMGYINVLYVYFIIAGGEGGFLRSTLEEEHVVREFGSF